jgi:hypothetical protein
MRALGVLDLDQGGAEGRLPAMARELQASALLSPSRAPEAEK